MNRRTFLHGTASLGAASLLPAVALAADSPLHLAQAQTPPNLEAGKVRYFNSQRPVRGVNLGGWLLLEKWISAQAFGTLEAKDEYELSGTPQGRAQLRDFRESYITEDDFKWIAARGLDAVRLPVGYWALEDSAPYISAPQVLDNAFAWAKNHGLGVLLDLHGAPGSQNGKDHSGHSGDWTWDKNPVYIERTLEVLESFARRYGQHPNLIGIELLNEPHMTMPMEPIKSFSQRAYARIRPHTSESVAIVIQDAFRPLEWGGFMAAPEYKSVLLDTHLYQCYTTEDKKRSIQGHIERATGRVNRLADMQKQLPTIVGEWSLCLRGEGVDGQNPWQRGVGRRAYGSAQLLSYETCQGWFFWTYKTDTAPRAEWSLRACIERGWMPENYSDDAPKTV